ncbi:Heat shock 70 kDa protein BIP1, partial [Linum perenne]
MSRVLANNQGNRITPSRVVFTESERLIGETAMNETGVNPKRAIFDCQEAILGRKFEDKGGPRGTYNSSHTR